MNLKQGTTNDGRQMPLPDGHADGPRMQAADTHRAETTRVEEIRRIVREAAWARMFGRNSAHNPFAR